MNIKQFSTVAVMWLGLIAAIAGGYGTLQTYRAQVDKEIDERKLQTFRLIERFGTKDMSETRERILPLVTTDTFCDPAARAKTGLTVSQMFAFVEFFDLVQTCIDARLCDGELAYEFVRSLRQLALAWHATRDRADPRRRARHGPEETLRPRASGPGAQARVRKQVR